MDGGGRLDQPLMRSGLSGERVAGAVDHEPGLSRVRVLSTRRRISVPGWFHAYAGMIARCSVHVRRLPSGVGVIGTVLLIAGSLAYGVVRGGHVADVVDGFKSARDTAANTAGFRITAVSLTGAKEVSREEILTTAGVTGNGSLLFPDADAARANTMGNPWIGSAAVVMADVGADTIVGAGSVVTTPLPPSVMAAGVPARVIKDRDGQRHGRTPGSVRS